MEKERRKEKKGTDSISYDAHYYPVLTRTFHKCVISKADVCK